MTYDDIDEFEKDYLPKRTENKYKRIEKYEPYELTHCIVYEMAIRNKEVKELIQNITAIKIAQDEVRKIISPRVETLFEEKDHNIPETILQRYKEYEQKYQELISLLKEKYYIHYNQNAVHIPEIENPFKDKDFTGMSGKEIFEDFQDALRAPMTKHISGEIGKFLHGEEYPLYKSDHNIYDGFVTARGINPRCKTFDISSINTHFQRKIYDTNQINVALNMSLSEKELVEYIKHIKRTLINPNSKKLKSPNKLLGKEVQTAIKTNHYPKNENAMNFADMFFVYDYVTNKLKDYSSNGQESVKTEIFDELEAVLKTAYYLKKLDKKNLDIKDTQDKIFEDLVSPLYRERIKLAQRKFKKKTIHEEIEDVCKLFEDFLHSTEQEVIKKRYSKKIDNPKNNKIFEDIETILFNKHLDKLHRKYEYINKQQRDKYFSNIIELIDDYKMGSSTISNYYYALKPYIEKCRYPEFLTGESIIEEDELDVKD